MSYYIILIILEYYIRISVVNVPPSDLPSIHEAETEAGTEPVSQVLSQPVPALPGGPLLPDGPEQQHVRRQGEHRQARPAHRLGYREHHQGLH